MLPRADPVRSCVVVASTALLFESRGVLTGESSRSQEKAAEAWRPVIAYD